MIWKDILLALLSTGLLGLNVVMTKIGVGDFPPLFFAFLRFFLILPFTFFIPKPQLSWSSLFLLGLCWGIIYLGGINYGLSTGIGAGTAVLIIQLSTFFSIVFAFIFLKESPKLKEILGILIGFCGIFLISQEEGLSAHFIGMFALFISAISFGFGTILSKKAKADPLSLTIWISALSAFPTLIMSFLFEKEIMNVITSASLKGWLAAFFGSFGSVLLGSVSWIYIVKKYPVSTSSSFRLLVPVFGLFFAVLFLNETYPLLSWCGAGLIMLGLIVSQLKFKTKTLSIESSK